MIEITKTQLIKILADSIKKHGDRSVTFELLGNASSAVFKIHDFCENDDLFEKFNLSRLSLICNIGETSFENNPEKLSDFIMKIDDWGMNSK